MNTLILGMVFSAYLQAGAAMPAYHTNCPAERVALKGIAKEEKVYFSQDCKTAYVMPPLETISVVGVAKSMSFRQCGAYESMARQVQQFYKSAESHSSAVDLELHNLALRNLKDLGSMGGSSAQLLINANWQGLVAGIRDRNPQIRIEAMPMEDLRLTTEDRLIGAYMAPRSSSVSIPGGLHSYGTMSAQVQLTMAGVCPLLDGFGNVPKRLTAKDLTVSYTLNR